MQMSCLIPETCYNFINLLKMFQPMEKPFPVVFPSGQIARATQINYSEEISIGLNRLGFARPRRSLVIVGGASGISEETMEQLQSLFQDVLAPLAERMGLVVIDGGTDAGVMKLIGQARAKIGGTFPLLGVAAIGTVVFPDRPAPSADAAPLEPNHTHFLFVPGNRWGDESPWLAQIATALAGTIPSVTLLINGGKIAWMDVTYSVQAERQVIVMAGSGRTADTLAAMLRGEQPESQPSGLTASGLVQAVDLQNGMDSLYGAIEKIFGIPVQ